MGDEACATQCARVQRRWLRRWGLMAAAKHTCTEVLSRLWHSLAVEAHGDAAGCLAANLDVEVHLTRDLRAGMRHRAESEESHESESHDFAMDTSETRVIITYDVDSYTSTVGQVSTGRTR